MRKRMRNLNRFLGLFLLLGLVIPTFAQEKRPSATPNATPRPQVSKIPQPGARPQFRPAVLGAGSDSLINRIDTNDLLKKGQKDGAVMFAALVSPNGDISSAWTYRPMPGTEALQQELQKRLASAKFTPPIYQYQPVGVLLFGTAIFSAISKPHIQIFLNQDPSELKAASDFIAPQPVIGGDSKFEGLTPPEGGTPVPLTAVVDLRLKVNREGGLEGIEVVGEEPPLLGFAEAAMANFRDAKFIPAFRNGDPDDASVTQPICYKPIE
ncbi:MAG: energy transducer TonB [Chthoniobacterales bacterium]